MSGPVARVVRSLLLAAFAGAPLLTAFACTFEDGVTPKCEPNVDAAGIDPFVAGGCNSFPRCQNDSGDPINARECCKDSNGKQLSGNALAYCLFFYGAARPPTADASANTGSTGDAGGD
jgi:hypothetical protein